MLFWVQLHNGCHLFDVLGLVLQILCFYPNFFDKIDVDLRLDATLIPFDATSKST